MTVLAGVDAGGSHTEAAVTETTTARVFRHRGAPSRLAAGQVGEAALIIRQIVTEAVSISTSTSIDMLVIGAAGAGDPALRDELCSALTNAKIARAIHVTTDAELQLDAAFPTGNGIMVAAGTGSIAMARDGKGTLHRAGGYGFRFGDEGSGYAIGRDAVRAALMATDGRGPDTVLVDLLRMETETKDESAFVLWTRAAERPAVAQLSSVVMLACQAGDAVAQHIIDGAAEDLVTHVLALAPYVATKNTTRVAMAGGLLDHDTPLRRHTISLLSRKVPGLDLFPAQIDPVSGALQIARRLIHHAQP